MLRRTIENPVTGERFSFETVPGRAGPIALRVEYTMKPGGQVPLHRHPLQEQRIQVLSGELRCQVGHRELTLRTGDECSIPAGVVHRQWNASAECVDTVEELEPPLRFEAFQETLCGLAREGRTKRVGIPNLLQAAVLFSELRDTVRIAGRGSRLTYALFRVLAPLGRLCGYRARYARYGALALEAARERS